MPRPQDKYELTKLTCDRCKGKVTRITNVGSGRCYCDECVEITMDQRVKLAQKIAWGPNSLLGDD